MALNLLRVPESSISPTVFGKLPHRADFIRINATHPVAVEFDERIQHALERFRIQEGWEERYDLAPIIDFCCPSGDQKWVFAGAWLSSHDQSTRRYPLVAGAAFPAQALGSERGLMPIACEVFFEGLREQLLNALDNSVEAMACRQFLEAQTAIWSSGATDFPLAFEIVQHFMDGHHPSVLEGPLAAAPTPGRLSQALLNLAFYRDFLRRFFVPSSSQVIELPLQGGRGEAALHASAWLAILSALAGDGGTWSGGFLLKQGRDNACLYTSFGTMPELAFLIAMGGETPEDGRLDIITEQKTWQAHKLYAETAYAMERLLSDPDLTLSELVAFLKNAGKRIAAAGN